MENNLFSKDFIEEIFSSNTNEAKSSIVTLSRFLIKEPLKEENAYLFFKIINKNIKEASDIIFSYKSPETFFSTLEPNKFLIKSAIDILVFHKPKELYEKNIICLLAVLHNAYKNGREGLKIYSLSISDIDHIAKYLILKVVSISDMILDVLDSIWQSDDKNHKDLIVAAKNIVDAYFDNKKDISKVLPNNLLL